MFKKQIKTIEDQGEKQIKVVEGRAKKLKRRPKIYHQCVFKNIFR